MIGKVVMYKLSEFNLNLLYPETRKLLQNQQSKKQKKKKQINVRICKCKMCGKVTSTDNGGLCTKCLKERREMKDEL